MTTASAAVAWAPQTSEIESRAQNAGIPIHANTVDEVLRIRAEAHPDEIAYVFLEDGEVEGPSYTYAQLDRRAKAIAAYLLEQCNPGDRALLIFPPGLDYMAAFFGCLYAGVVAVPVYPPDPGRLNRSLPRLKVIANDADTHIALTTNYVMPLCEMFSAQDPDFAKFTWMPVDSIPDEKADSWRGEISKSDSVAFLQYTSGSTADPKGVMVTHANLLYNLWDLSYLWHSEMARGRLVTWLPAYHDMGLIFGLLYPMYLRWPCYVMSPLAFLQHPVRWLQAIAKYKATYSCAPNFAFDLCSRKVTAAQKASLDLSSWSVAGNGSEPIRPETLERFVEAFKECGITPSLFKPGYGLAEATLKVCGTRPDEMYWTLSVSGEELEHHRVVIVARDTPGARTLVGNGRSHLTTRTIIVDRDTGIQCKPDTVGEIWVAGPTIANGYWNQPEATDEIFNARLSDTNEGPFLRTGDLGFLHDGVVYVTGRIKDLIIVDGANHYPQDIEIAVEKSHAAIRPGCVIAFSIVENGEEKLVVVAEAGGIPEGDNEAKPVITAVRKAVAQEHNLRVHKVCLIQPRSITKTSSGKLQRQASKRGYLEDTLDVIAVG
ncbi:MAG: fatty acyl-AMP ligase [Candidatus Hydrogenedentes bacterium]|nr:fatty acyl-AMP ligase [Candidatus Hydrogenedentota bacterium]